MVYVIRFGFEFEGLIVVVTKRDRNGFFLRIRKVKESLKESLLNEPSMTMMTISQDLVRARDLIRAPDHQGPPTPGMYCLI